MSFTLSLLSGLRRSLSVSTSGARSFRQMVCVGAAAVLVLLGGGCATADYTYVTTISTGERLHFPLVKGVPERAKSGSVEILQAVLLPGAVREKKEVYYLFTLVDKAAEGPRSIVVEDVSDEAAIMMVDDVEPKLAEQRWVGKSRLYTVEDSALNWLSYLDDSIRVFRFTVTSAHGKKTVLHHAWIVPAPTKAAMRAALAMK